MDDKNQKSPDGPKIFTWSYGRWKSNCTAKEVNDVSKGDVIHYTDCDGCTYHCKVNELRMYSVKFINDGRIRTEMIQVNKALLQEPFWTTNAMISTNLLVRGAITGETCFELDLIGDGKGGGWLTKLVQSMNTK